MEEEEEEEEEVMSSLPLFVEKLVACKEQRGSVKSMGIRTLTRALGLAGSESLRSSRRKLVTAKLELRKSGCAGSTAARSRK